MESPDFSKTDKLFELFAEGAQRGDEAWKREFYSAFPDAVLRFTYDEAVDFGPDGLPYVRVSLPQPGEGFTPVVIRDLISWITECGIGVVFNESEGRPGWVFPYGQMWSWREFGEFELPESQNPPGDEYLPQYVREVLHRFMTQSLEVQEEPKVVLMTHPDPPHGKSLVFSLYPEDFPSEEHYDRVLHLMRWFLPTNYAVMGVPKGSPYTEELTPLVSQENDENAPE